MLDACPVCRSTLREQTVRCPDCGTELQPFLDRQHQQAELLKLVRRYLSAGELPKAEHILGQLSHINDLPPELLRELNCRLALVKGDVATARSLATQLPEVLGAELLRSCDAHDAAVRQAHELYNSALWRARQGSYSTAVEELALAVQLAPQDPRIWLLKLKVELKARQFKRCYASLAALDRLHARPNELARLEALLPATAVA